ncbi:MAG TPA: adenylate kinase [Firmicutes bacterium]|nr:adenylate kinase [Bacillota bacterium]
MTVKIKRLLLFGPPGAGKGTQAAKVAKRLGIPHIDTGSIIRDNIKNNTPLGVEAKSYVEKGELIPNELVIRLIADRLSQPDAKEGWLLDGFPRSLEQARALSSLGPNGGEAVEKVVSLEVDENLLVQRLTSRRICPDCKAVYNVITLKPKVDGICDKCSGQLIQRPDDNEESIRTRFRVYHEETAPIADYYREKGLLVSIDGSGTVEEGTERIMDALSEKTHGCSCCGQR